MKLLLMPFCLISFQRFSLFVACSESVLLMRQSSTNLVFQTLGGGGDGMRQLMKSLLVITF